MNPKEIIEYEPTEKSKHGDRHWCQNRDLTRWRRITIAPPESTPVDCHLWKFQRHRYRRWCRECRRWILLKDDEEVNNCHYHSFINRFVVLSYFSSHNTDLDAQGYSLLMPMGRCFWLPMAGLRLNLMILRMRAGWWRVMCWRCVRQNPL